MDTKELRDKAKKIRRMILEMTYRGKEGHIGTDFSCVEILTALFLGNVLRVKPEDPQWAERDRFLLSKGHGAAALYATLAMKGFFSEELLDSFCREGSTVSAHVTLGCLPGVETTAGSGGHGLPMAIGMALAAKHDLRPSRIFVLVGDGECQEGSIWEAILFAGHHHLENLTLIIDNNGLQTSENTRKVVDLEPLPEKMRSFGWSPEEISDGHDFNQILNAFMAQPEPGFEKCPRAIIAKTKKGYGVSFMVDNPVWHGRCPDEEQYFQALKELS